MTRTRSEVVTFTQPFGLRGFDNALPAGSYVVETDEELLPALLHPAYRRTATWLTLPSQQGAGTTELVAIDPAELAAALAQDSQGAVRQADASTRDFDQEEETQLLKSTDRSPRSVENKEERARQAERAMKEYTARKAVIAAQTEKLRELRLARDAEIGDAGTAKTRRTKKAPSVDA